MVHKLSNDFSRFEYPHDVFRIVKIALEHDVVLSGHEAESAWSEHSDTMCAGWIGLPDEDTDVWFSLPAWARCEE